MLKGLLISKDLPVSLKQLISTWLEEKKLIKKLCEVLSLGGNSKMSKLILGWSGAMLHELRQRLVFLSCPSPCFHPVKKNKMIQESTVIYLKPFWWYISPHHSLFQPPWTLNYCTIYDQIFWKVEKRRLLKESSYILEIMTWKDLSIRLKAGGPPKRLVHSAQHSSWCQPSTLSN